jgi:hypothetical protein
MGKSQNCLHPDRAKRQKTITPAPFAFEKAMRHNGQFAMSSPITGGKIRQRGIYVNGFFEVFFRFFLEGEANPENITLFSRKLIACCWFQISYDNPPGSSLFSVE